MIEIENLCKSYQDNFVLNNISLHIPRGSIFGLVGRSGAGKSTLLRCINGLEQFQSGNLIVDGIAVQNLTGNNIRQFRKEIGVIFQNFSLLQRLSVYDNIALPMRCWKYSKNDIDKIVTNLLELVDIPEKIYSYPRELSGGQKQRVAIARALTMNPKILLCDEATSALDPKSAQSVTSLLNRINQELGITIIVVTHQMSVLRSCCEQIAILENGKVQVSGKVEDIFLEQPPSLVNLIGEKYTPLDKEVVSSGHSYFFIKTLYFQGLQSFYKTKNNDPLFSVIIESPQNNFCRKRKVIVMSSIITYLLIYNQYLIKQIYQLTLFIAKHIPIKQWAFEDSNSPVYQKLKIDKLPIIKKFVKQDYSFLLEYYLWKYGKPVKSVQRRNGKTIPEKTVCPLCSAPHQYIYDNNGGNGQYQCKICGQTFITGEQVTSPLVLICPYCGHTLVPTKDRKHFIVHKCVNKKCSYYTANSKQLPKDLDPKDKYKYKLHYIYREFTVDFFSMDLNQLPSWVTSFKFRKNNAHIMGLCLTYHVNLGLSLRKTAQALHDVHNINISHTMVASYARTAAVLIKPFVDTFDYNPSNNLAADETYIKIKGLKGYVWLIMDTVSRSILGYQVSKTRDVGPCILTMRMAFDKFKEFPGKALKFIADGYSAYPLAAQQFKIEKGWDFNITQFIGLTNDDSVFK